MIDYARLAFALGLGLLFGGISLLGYRSLSSQTALAESLPEPYDRVITFRANRVKLFANALLGLFLVALAGSPYVLIFLGPETLWDWLLIVGLGALFPFILFLELKVIVRFFAPDMLTVDEEGFSIRRLGRTRDYKWAEVDEPRFIHFGDRVITTAIEVPFYLSDKRPLKILADEYWGSPESMLSVMLHKYRKASGQIAPEASG